MNAIGALCARVRLERALLVADDLGGGRRTWEQVRNVWAAIEAQAADRDAAHDGVRSWSRFSVRIRRADVQPGWRLIWKDRALEILGVLDDGGPYLDLVCEEERP